MADRWKALPASAYKEDFWLRGPAVPPDYKTRPADPVRRQRKHLPISCARFTNTDKVLWPQEGYTKTDLINYYAAVAETLLPHLCGRPIIMERHPNGIAEKYFLQKDAMPQHTPDWLLLHILDYLQNGRGKALASVDSVRARPGSPVSTPLKWSEVQKDSLEPSEFNIETVPKRIQTVGDLFSPVLRDKQDIRHLIDALRAA
jgi:DNA primase